MAKKVKSRTPLKNHENFFYKTAALLTLIVISISCQKETTEDLHPNPTSYQRKGLHLQ